MEKLIGRKQECEELKWAMESNRSELIILYGRRRIGKTFLVRRFFQDKYSFHYVGAHRQKKSSSVTELQGGPRSILQTQRHSSIQ